MKAVFALISRNRKLFFKDRGMFFSALITPGILILLYATFLNVSPISKAQLYLGYFLSTVVNSLLVNGLALVLCLGYMYKMGWYMSAVDVFWVLLDEILLVLFGSTLSSIVSFPLTTQGQLSAVGTIVSAGYGFLCGAYMPISNFGSGLQKVLSYLPSMLMVGCVVVFGIIFLCMTALPEKDGK